MKQALRPYQNETLDAFNEIVDKGIKRVLTVSPTGTGKTTMFSKLASENQNSKKVLTVVHRTELVDQIAARYIQFGIEPQIISNEVSADDRFQVYIATIQSLAAMKYKVKADLIIIDECHHSPASTYLELWDRFPNAIIAGFTATPCRLDGKSFRGIYDQMINLYPISWFIERGYLVQPKHYVCYNMDLKEIPQRSGEFVRKKASEKSREPKVLANIVKSYQRYSHGKKAIVFANDLQHSNDIVRRFNEVGIPAAHIDGSMTGTERAKVVADYTSGKLLVLSNFDIVSEGFDVPDTDTVILARPTTSLSVFIQMIGRALRPMPGKTHAYILDCASCWKIHGFAGIDYPWALDANQQEIEEAIAENCKIPRKLKKGVREYSLPYELSDVDLIALNSQMDRLQLFDSLIKDYHDPMKAIQEYIGYLHIQGFYISEMEATHLINVLNKQDVFLTMDYFFPYMEPSIERLIA